MFASRIISVNLDKIESVSPLRYLTFQFYSRSMKLPQNYGKSYFFFKNGSKNADYEAKKQTLNLNMKIPVHLSSKVPYPHLFRWLFHLFLFVCDMISDKRVFSLSLLFTKRVVGVPECVCICVFVALCVFCECIAYRV